MSDYPQKRSASEMDVTNPSPDQDPAAVEPPTKKTVSVVSDDLTINASVKPLRIGDFRKKTGLDNVKLKIFDISADDWSKTDGRRFMVSGQLVFDHCKWAAPRPKKADGTSAGYYDYLFAVGPSYIAKADGKEMFMAFAIGPLKSKAEVDSESAARRLKKQQEDAEATAAAFAAYGDDSEATGF